MKYEIYLGKTALYGVDSVGVEAARPVSVFDAVGAGKFPLAEHCAPRRWSIQCELTERNERGLPGWRRASKVLDALEAMLDSREPVRMILRTGQGKTNEPVLVESISKEETVMGVYAVKLSCTEYTAVGVKTTGVPYVERPGKVPPLPKTVEVTPVTPYEIHRKGGKLENSKTRVPVTNPCVLKAQERVMVVAREDSNSAFFTEQQKEEAWLAASRGEISSALEQYEEEDTLPSYGTE